eukprot:scaffold1953_cov91-Alexandrium_tamarense.AAC.1
MLLTFNGIISSDTGEVKSRTMAIETSMKSSAFGFLLAKLHFGDYIARVPSAMEEWKKKLRRSVAEAIGKRNCPLFR